MKKIFILLAVLSMSACSSMGTGAFSATADQAQPEKPYSQRVFDANSPYHGG